MGNFAPVPSRSYLVTAWLCILTKRQPESHEITANSMARRRHASAWLQTLRIATSPTTARGQLETR